MASLAIRVATTVAGLLASAAWLDACTPAPAGHDAGVIHPERGTFDRVPGQTYFCDLAAPDVPLAGLPAGFCVRRFATGVAAARVLAFAPNGDVFVSSPAAQTPGLAAPGQGQILVLPDDNHDGVSDGAQVFLDNQPFVHGMLFASGSLYFTTDTAVFRVPYMAGMRHAMPAQPERVADLSGLLPAAPRWTHTLVQDHGGAIYVSIGQYNSYTCPPGPRSGVIARLVAGGGTPEVIARGFRNPMFLRCDPDGARCFAAELSDDGWDPSTGTQGREKLVVLNAGDDYGYPCCAGAASPAPPGRRVGMTDCAVASELRSFPLHDTPFGMDFDRGHFPGPWQNGFFVGLHGAFQTWENTKVEWSPVDPATHLPTGAWQDFLTGWGSASTGIVGRITDVGFAADGRLFVTDDQGAAVYWVAPEMLTVPGM